MADGAVRRGDVISGSVLAGLGIYIILESQRWDYTTPDGPGPGMFPMWYGVFMLALSVVLVVSTLASAHHQSPSAPINWAGIGNALAAWAAFAACIGLLKVLGFILSFALLTYFIAAWCYQRTARTALAAAIGCPLGFYLLFPLALNVSLPVGIFGF